VHFYQWYLENYNSNKIRVAGIRFQDYRKKMQ